MKTLKSRAYRERLRGHKDTVLNLYAPDGPEGHILLSGAADGVVRAWDLKGRSVLFKLLLQRPDSNSDIMFFNFTGTSVNVGYADGNICSYSLNSSELKCMMTGHVGSVNSILFHDGKLYSAGQDGTVRVWNMKDTECEVIYQFTDPISAICYKNDTLYAASWDKMVRLINPKDHTVKESILASENAIRAILVDEEWLYTAGCEPTVRGYNLETGEHKTFYGHRSWVYGLNTFQNFLYSYSDDKSIRVWDIKTSKCVEEFLGHEDGVTCLEFVDNMIYTGSMDHSIRSWDLKELYKRVFEREMMTKEDILSRKIEVYQRLLKAKKGKKKGKKGKKKGGKKKKA